MKQPQKIGVFGGTFDPVHKGHVECIRDILKSDCVNKILIVPSGNPPHKNAKRVTSLEHRIKMLEIAFSGIKKTEILKTESETAGPCYTYLTMRDIKKIYSDSKLFFIIGEDNLKNIHKWKEYKTLINENDFILMRRGGYNIKREDLKNLGDEEYHKLAAWIVQTHLIFISSTKLRMEIKKGNSLFVRDFIAPEVYKYISGNMLYK